MSQLGLLLISCSYLSLFVLGFLDNSRGPLYPQILQELGLNSSYGSLVFVIPSFFAFFGSLLAKFFVDRVASVQGLFFGGFSMASGYLLFSYNSSLLVITICLGLFGFGLGVTSVFEHVSIQKAASEKSRRRWLSGLHTIYAFASLAAPLLIHWGLGFEYTWRDFFRLFSLSSFVIVAFLFLVMLFYSKKDLAMPFAKTRKSNYVINSSQSVWMICLVVSFYVCAEVSIATRMTQLLTSDQGVVLEVATKYVTCFFLCLFLGRLFFTFVSFPNVSSSKLLIISHIISIVLLVGGLVFSPWLLVLCGLSMAPCYALNMDYIADIYKENSPKVMAQAMSVTSLVVVSVHYLLGVITDWLSVSKALLLSPVLLVICLFVLLAFDKKYTVKKEVI